MKVVCLFVSFFFISFCANSQHNEIEVYYAMKALNNEEMEMFNQSDFKKAHVIYQRNFDPDDDGVLDEEGLREAIIAEIPSESDIELGILDWEGKTIRKLSALPPGSKQFQRISAEFIRAITIAKDVRPNIKWGFYDIPMRRYFNKDNNWIEASSKLLPILRECDFIAPSLYMAYPRSRERIAGVEGFLKYNIKIALKLGEKIKKPVIPFIWHRTIDIDKETGYGLISESDFNQYVQEMITVTRNGKRISGMIWWNDKSLHSNPQFKKQIRSFKRPDRELEEGSLSILKRYNKSLTTILSD